MRTIHSDFSNSGGSSYGYALKSIEKKTEVKLLHSDTETTTFQRKISELTALQNLQIARDQAAQQAELCFSNSTPVSKTITSSTPGDQP